jgi:hypothetical protein
MSGRRPYLKRAVYVGIVDPGEGADPADGVPYWLIATRHPERLAAAIEEARPPGGHQHDGHETGSWEPVG